MYFVIQTFEKFLDVCYGVLLKILRFLEPFEYFEFLHDKRSSLTVFSMNLLHLLFDEALLHLTNLLSFSLNLIF